MNELYTGYKILQLSDKELTNLYSGKFEIDGLKENEYLIIEDGNKEAIDYYCFRDGKLERVKYPILENTYTGQIKPRNPQQYCAMDLLKNEKVPIKLITGNFGSGKTLLCVVGALEAIQKGLFEKIIFVRNNVQVKDTDQIGSLPGDVLDKTLPYVMPFADHCGGVEGIEHLIENGRLEVIPLGFLRGRSISNSIIYSMESENLTKQHIQLIMGRVDEGSQLWLDGDIKQRDRTAFEQSMGLEKMVDRLSGNRLFGYVHLIKSERSEVARLCDLLD